MLESGCSRLTAFLTAALIYAASLATRPISHLQTPNRYRRVASHAFLALFLLGPSTAAAEPPRRNHNLDPADRRPSVQTLTSEGVFLPVHTEAERAAPATLVHAHTPLATTHPFISPLLASSLGVDDLGSRHRRELLPRKDDGNCPDTYHSCSGAGSTFCCAWNQKCSQDEEGRAGCCPVGAVCTGLVSTTATATTTGSPTLPPESEPTPSVTTTLSFLAPAAYVPVQDHFVENDHFPFPRVPGAFDDLGACSRAWSVCATNSAGCSSWLVGREGRQITIQDFPASSEWAPIGTTVFEPGQFTSTGLPAEVARLVCSSISSEACNGQFDVSQCQTAGRGLVGIVVGAAPARPTPPPGYAVRAGVAIAAAGAAVAGAL